MGADTLHHQTEGTILTQLGGELRLLASDGDAKDYPVYDLQMNRIAQIRAQYESNIPHPFLIDGPEAVWMMTSTEPLSAQTSSAMERMGTSSFSNRARHPKRGSLRAGRCSRSVGHQGKKHRHYAEADKGRQ